MSFVRYRGVVAGGICVTLLCCFYIFGRSYQGDKQLAFKENQIKDSSIDYITKNTWNDRIQHLQKGCSQSDEKDKYKIQYRQSTAIFFQSKKLNISVCKVAKAGSTFWAIVFLIVQRGMPATQAFSIPRHRIHAMTGGITKTLRASHEQLGTTGVVVSRDPYSRLFSAFIDKFFLLRFVQNAKSLATSLRKGLFMTKAGECGYNVSFQDFVDSETTKALQGRGINRHWCPVYTMCRVCDVEYQYVIQQETLTRDTEYIIDQLNISSDIKTTLTKMFHGSGKNSTMEGVIKTMWSAIDNPAMQACCSKKLAYFMKMWEGFKIQGYIRTDISFPLSAFQAKNSVNVEKITKAVITAMNTNPLSSEERKAQRRQALVKAYEGMPKRIIYRIQEMYKMDFYLFGYDKNPPS
ncbi:carbohydrate sulfotransferase 10-like [Pecten maximus]|uniref:carbohydrate sulfotransferase 10-like n=1 Tax=Pecten maximus TaxID=6579 RepID=UPI0014590069|nr:carbohydrate sulfotransferase 10-like [Pecten maximus]